MELPNEGERKPHRKRKRKIADLKARPPKPEKIYQAEAFEVYYALGDQRSHGKVAQMIHRGDRAVWEWAQLFNWKERVEERDKMVRDKIEERAKKDAVTMKSTLLNFWKHQLAQCFPRDKNGKAKLAFTAQNVTDAEKITKMVLLLSGEPTERIEMTKAVISKVIAVINLHVKDDDARFRIYEELSGVIASGGSEEGADEAAQT